MKPKLFYDNTCGFCAKSVLFLQKIDTKKRLQFIGLSTQVAKKQIPSKILQHDSVILFFQNKYYIYSTAILKALTIIGGFYKIAVLGYIIPKTFRDFLYKYIAKKRK